MKSAGLDRRGENRFATATHSHSGSPNCVILTPQRKGQGMRVLGLWLIGLGVAGMALAFLFPVEASTGLSLLDQIKSGLPGEVANGDLIAQRAMLHASAGVVAIVGAVLAIGERSGDQER